MIGPFLLLVVIALLLRDAFRDDAVESTVPHCTDCGARFLRSEAVAQHVAAAHPRVHEELFVCLLCGDDVIGDGAMLAHMERRHGGQR